jgi:type II secretory pathway pseudopilin PulG
MRSGSRRAGSRGFTYLLLLVLVAVLALAAAGSVTVGTAVTRRHAEAALLLAGEDIRAALLSYRGNLRNESASPGRLSDLLRDPRVPGVRRHLRQIPHDPLTGTADWGELRDGANRIVGVYSLATGRPIKRAGFSPSQTGFDEADSYRRWIFAVVPVSSVVPQQPPAGR